MEKEETKTTSETNQSSSQGFMFCPRCGHTIVGENMNGFCSNCGYHFCPSCSE